MIQRGRAGKVRAADLGSSLRNEHNTEMNYPFTSHVVLRVTLQHGRWRQDFESAGDGKKNPNMFRIRALRQLIWNLACQGLRLWNHAERTGMLRVSVDN